MVQGYTKLLEPDHPEIVDAFNKLKRCKGSGKDTWDVDGNNDHDDWVSDDANIDSNDDKYVDYGSLVMMAVNIMDNKYVDDGTYGGGEDHGGDGNSDDQN